MCVTGINMDTVLERSTGWRSFRFLKTIAVSIKKRMDVAGGVFVLVLASGPHPSAPHGKVTERWWFWSNQHHWLVSVLPYSHDIPLLWPVNTILHFLPLF